MPGSRPKTVVKAALRAGGIFLLGIPLMTMSVPAIFLGQLPQAASRDMTGVFDVDDPLFFWVPPGVGFTQTNGTKNEPIKAPTTPVNSKVNKGLSAV